ncbi:amidohydrolase [Tissierella praeacuta]|uniref:Aminobenzoyl-glutamate utilization protein B n=1 Tax=Tissierella praeacuta DSM 18095 TaxID=1123404 RepID=A0A1M4T9J0_9FIRM|nr:amidohydrolase [Tissierella praeacuta]MBU5257189.1 amidohydrolase [Tissierella praeacuta]TCU68166.1 aminobenzoyl-glutamate utilization protein B [Tissierella praeacuta]SHE41169.1 aminobenzoyl-glutamate utilization protein B [Tissierella praeacuta DSM 18095]SUP04823.1 Aminobenzoyl-glutamate utilization protein B [Tissierella praeacuta]
MNKLEVLKYLEDISEEVKEVSLKVWNNPETSGNEKDSSSLFRKVLKSHGFEIKEIDGMENAFIGEYGKGSPVIAVLGEYDALPGLSQSLDTKFNPVEINGPGHGCGHNLLGSAALGSVLAVKKYLEETKASGTVRFYGCPEEETLIGKVKMIKAGAFDGCDLALSWHPMNANVAIDKAYLANSSIKFKFHGISAHAAQSPESGRSALDAVELMNVGANYLREHVIDSARIHYTITNAGGAPNIVPKEAESWYFVRAPYRKDVEEITERLFKIAKGAAMMTETTVEYEILGGCYEKLPNNVLYDLTHKNMVEIGVPSYTDEELEFAKTIQETLESNLVEAEIKKYIDSDEKIFLHQEVLDKDKVDSVVVSGSSDSGDVSWIMPMNLFLTATWPLGVPAHSWQATSSSGSSMGLKGMIYAAEIFTGMMYDLLNNPKLVEEAKNEFNKRTEKRKYISPLK